MIFAKTPIMSPSRGKLAPQIQIALFCGENSFLKRSNAKLVDWLAKEYGNENFKCFLLPNLSHDLYTSATFAEKFDQYLDTL